MILARGALGCTAIYWCVLVFAGELYPLSGYGPDFRPEPEPWERSPAFMDPSAAHRLVEGLPAGTYRPLDGTAAMGGSGWWREGWRFRPDQQPPAAAYPRRRTETGGTRASVPASPGYRFRPRSGTGGTRRYQSYDPLRESGAGYWRAPLSNHTGEGYYPAEIPPGIPGYRRP